MSRRIAKATRLSIAAAGATALLVGLAPLSASAAEVNYQFGHSAQNVWNYSGHQNMSGSVAYGYAISQLLSLKQANVATQINGYDEVRISTPSSAFTLSMCGWSGAAEGTSFALTCNYIN